MNRSPLFLTIILFLFFSTIFPARALQGKGLPNPKNIILLIGDGMGFNHIQAANYYLGVNRQVYEQFPVRLACSHYPAKAGSYGKDDSESNIWANAYNTVSAWNDTAWLQLNATESAAAATALATGVKTYNNSIGISVTGDTMVNLVQWAKNIGKSAGVVSSVPFSHATPAGFVAHNATRSHYSEIAREMVLDSRCDVIMGCGNPEFDNNGLPWSGSWKNAKYVGDSAFWLQVKTGSGSRVSFDVKGNKKTVQDTGHDGKPDPWTVVTGLREFNALTAGKTPERVLGCAEVNQTLQQSRDMKNSETKDSPPFVTPYNSTVPTLATMTRGAINVLDNNAAGFFLMIEGGAIDWAAHSNQKGRLIEELKDFNETVKSVADWIEKNSSWEETLVIVLADHETGFLWGEEPFKPLQDNGPGKLPGMKFYNTDHTNSLVPVFAKGAGSELLKQYADEIDQVRGQYIQNTEISQLIHMLWVK